MHVYNFNVLQAPMCNADYLSILSFTQNFHVIHVTVYFTANMCYVFFHVYAIVFIHAG